jgi:hypothetical protein
MQNLTPLSNKILAAYNNLNEMQKKALREAFFTEFDYSPNSNTFWRKLHNPKNIWKNERAFFAGHLKTTVNKLFKN